MTSFPPPRIPSGFRLSGTLAFLSVVLAASLTACGGSGGGGSSAQILSPTTAAQVEWKTQTKYAVLLVSERNGSLISDDIAVTFTGNATLVDVEGNSLNGKTVTTNTGTIGLGANFKAAESFFTVSAGNQKRGWSTVSKRIVGDSAVTGTKVVELRLFNSADAAAITADPTKGIASANKTAPDLGSIGVVASPAKTFTRDDGATVGVGSATVAFQGGTKVIDPATGAAVPVSGAVTVASTMYSTADDDTLTSLAGGPRPLLAAGVAGNPGSDPGVLEPAGFASFSVTDAEGTILRNFDKPLTLSIDLPKTTVDAGGNPVVAGSKIPVWSYDEATASWKFEKEGTVSEKAPVDPDNFMVSFLSNHLSVWSLGFTGKTCTGLVILDRGTDTQGLKMILTGTEAKPYKAVLSNVRESRLQFYYSSTQKFSVEVQLYNKTIAKTAPASICGEGIVVPLALPAATQSGTIKVNGTESCTDGSNARPLPNMFIYLTSLDRPTDVSFFYTEGADASATFLKVPAGKYNVKGSYTTRVSTDTVRMEKEVTVSTDATSSLTFNVPRLVCKPVTGAS
jgi:hypothetical protein